MDGISFHTPDYDGSAPLICKRLALPSFLWRYFSGAYGELLEIENWINVGSMPVDDVVQAFQRAFSDMRPCNMIGQIVTFSSLILPDDVLLCDGSKYDTAAYPELYTHLGTDTLPDLRGRFVLGHGNGRSPGDIGGEESHTLTIPEIPEHWHSYIPPTFNVDVEAPGAPDLLAAGIGVSTPTGTAGGGQPHNNMPPFFVLVYAIVAK